MQLSTIQKMFFAVSLVSSRNNGRINTITGFLEGLADSNLKIISNYPAHVKTNSAVTRSIIRLRSFCTLYLSSILCALTAQEITFAERYPKSTKSVNNTWFQFSPRRNQSSRLTQKRLKQSLPRPPDVTSGTTGCALFFGSCILTYASFALAPG